MNAEELRDELQLELRAELGTFLIAGQSTPAIAILANGEGLPNDRGVSGLELIIVKSPIDYRPKTQFGGTNQIKTWQIFLTQYSGAYTIDAALRKIGNQFVNTRASVTTVEKNKNIKEQYSVRIPDVTEFDT